MSELVYKCCILCVTYRPAVHWFNCFLLLCTAQLHNLQDKTKTFFALCRKDKTALREHQYQQLCLVHLRILIYIYIIQCILDRCSCQTCCKHATSYSKWMCSGNTCLSTTVHGAPRHVYVYMSAPMTLSQYMIQEWDKLYWIVVTMNFKLHLSTEFYYSSMWDIIRYNMFSHSLGGDISKNIHTRFALSPAHSCRFFLQLA